MLLSVYQINFNLFFFLVRYIQNAATHKKIFGSGLSSVKLTWVAPPELSEEVKFYATVVLNGGIFWVNSVVEQVKVV